MKYLLDTNILLEGLLQQEKAEDIREFLNKIEQSDIAITDFSIHSIGIILLRLKRHKIFSEFLNDLLQSSIEVISLPVSKLQKTLEISVEYNLDFDDAYQYAVAEEFNLIIVSFDKDFDKTPRKRKEPVELL